jgi:hypothetical protein
MYLMALNNQINQNVQTPQFRRAMMQGVGMATVQPGSFVQMVGNPNTLKPVVKPYVGKLASKPINIKEGGNVISQIIRSLLSK